MSIAFFEIEDWEIDYLKTRIYTDKNTDSHRSELFFFKEKLNKDNLPEILRQSSGQVDFDIISVFVGSSVDKEVINSFPNLKLITTRSTGFDHIDIAAAKEKNIPVAFVPGYGDNTVAEFAFGLILNLSRKIYTAFDQIRETASFSLEGLRGFDLNGKTIGIIGTGRIGCYMIKIANGFGMNVIAYDAFQKQELCEKLGFKYVSLDELLGQSDIISIHVPYLESTHHLINSQNISKIKKGALLINTSRGQVVETEALVRGLNEKILGGVGLDVLEEEGAISDERALMLYGHPEEHNLKTILANHVLIDMPNVIITPHNAFNTQEALQRILNTDLENIKSFMEKNLPRYSTG